MKSRVSLHLGLYQRVWKYNPIPTSPRERLRVRVCVRVDERVLFFSFTVTVPSCPAIGTSEIRDDFSKLREQRPRPLFGPASFFSGSSTGGRYGVSPVAAGETLPSEDSFGVQ